MNKRITWMVLSLLLCTGFAISCGDDDEQKPGQTPETPTVNTLAGKYGGWTLGSNAYSSFIPSENDTLTIVLTNKEGTLCSLTYESETWGTVTLADVSVVKNDTAYLFSKPRTATLREDRSAWDFSAAVDSIAMPNRNPQTEEVTVKNYPLVLTEGFMSLDGKRWQIDFDAFLVPRSAHTMHMSFRDGHIQAPQ